MHAAFRKFAHRLSIWMGSPWAFTGAFGLIIIWAALGPKFNFSDTWELIINTLTTIVTFLMVFLIQNTQNRDMRSLQLKLDELIRASKRARTNLVDLEDMEEEELDTLQKEFEKLRLKKGNNHKTQRH